MTRHRVDDSALQPSTLHRTAPQGQHLAAGTKRVARPEPDNTAAAAGPRTDAGRTEIACTGVVRIEAAQKVAVELHTEAARTAAAGRPAAGTAAELRLHLLNPDARLVLAAMPEPAVQPEVRLLVELAEPVADTPAVGMSAVVPSVPGTWAVDRPVADTQAARTSVLGLSALGRSVPGPLADGSVAPERSQRQGFPQAGSPEDSSSTGLVGDSS